MRLILSVSARWTLIFKFSHVFGKLMINKWGGYFSFIFLFILISNFRLGHYIKHIAFLELSSEWHPSSWASDGRWTRGTLELSSGWRVLQARVCWLWHYKKSCKLWCLFLYITTFSNVIIYACDAFQKYRNSCCHKI